MEIHDLIGYADWFIRAAAAVLAGVCGATMLERRSDGAGKLMGWMALVLMLGGAGELLFRVLGAGPLGRSAGLMFWTLALTVFCVLLVLVWEKLCEAKQGFYSEMLLRHFSGIRALGCIAPFVARLAYAMQGESTDILSGAPLAAGFIAPGIRCLGLAVAAGVGVRLYRKTAGQIRALNKVWLWLLGAAALEIVSELGAVVVPALEMLHLAALVCLSGLLLSSVRFSGEENGD